VDIDLSQPIPIFPLPQTVLLPRAVLPLHLFEPRYRDMANDALATQRCIAMALLQPGYEEKYYTHVAAIHPVLCLGQIVRSEMLGDGRFNLLLQGVSRVRCSREDREKSYRRGWMTPLAPQTPLPPTRVEAARAVLSEALRGDEGWQAAEYMRGVIECPTLDLSDQVDLLAFNLLCDADTRQRFLNEPCPLRRAGCLSEIIHRLRDESGETAGAAARRRCTPSDN